MPRYRVSDVITISRKWIVEAPDENAAIAQIEDGLPEVFDRADTEVLASEPYEADLLE